VQNIIIQQNPYQWRRQLATLRVYTAAGSLIIPFISEKRAQELLDFFIYQVENSRKPWM
jgi:putative membrane protein